MGRTTNIIISTNRSTKTQQKQTVWFGDGEIRLNGETGQYIGKYEKNGAWWNAEVHFGGEVKELSQPTATQAAQSVAWAWLACKALEGFAAAAAPVLADMDTDAAYKAYQEDQAIRDADTDAKDAAAEEAWEQYRRLGKWWFFNSRGGNMLIFNAAEERAFYTTMQGEILRYTDDAKCEFHFAFTRWEDAAVSSYTYKHQIWARYFRATFGAFHGSDYFDVNVDEFRQAVDYFELETPEQVAAWLFISEAFTPEHIPEWAMRMEFRWKVSFLAEKNYFSTYVGKDGVAWRDCEATPEEERTIVVECE